MRHRRAARDGTPRGPSPSSHFVTTAAGTRTSTHAVDRSRELRAGEALLGARRERPQECRRARRSMASPVPRTVRVDGLLDRDTVRRGPVCPDGDGSSRFAQRAAEVAIGGMRSSRASGRRRQHAESRGRGRRHDRVGGSRRANARHALLGPEPVQVPGRRDRSRGRRLEAEGLATHVVSSKPNVRSGDGGRPQVRVEPMKQASQRTARARDRPAPWGATARTPGEEVRPANDRAQME